MTSSLQKSLQSTSTVSVYSGNLTNECLIKQVKRIKDAFPSLHPGFFDVLTGALKDEGFCDDRLVDAVNRLVREFRYPVPTVSEIVSFDKRYKLYTYYEVIDKVNEGMKFDEFERQENGRYVCKAEIH